MDEIVISFSEILAVTKNNSNDILSFMEPLSNQITSIDSKISLVWILGNYGEKLESCPYMLENFVDELISKKDEAQEDKDENDINNSPVLKLQLMTSVIKTFMTKPAEMHPGLCK